MYLTCLPLAAREGVYKVKVPEFRGKILLTRGGDYHEIR
jgi:hypothetical protein